MAYTLPKFSIDGATALKPKVTAPPQSGPGVSAALALLQALLQKQMEADPAQGSSLIPPELRMPGEPVRITGDDGLPKWSVPPTLTPTPPAPKAATPAPYNDFLDASANPAPPPKAAAPAPYNDFLDANASGLPKKATPPVVPAPPPVATQAPKPAPAVTPTPAAVTPAPAPKPAAITPTPAPAASTPTPAPKAPWENIDYDAAYKAQTPAQVQQSLADASLKSAGLPAPAASKPPTTPPPFKPTPATQPKLFPGGEPFWKAPQEPAPSSPAIPAPFFQAPPTGQPEAKAPGALTPSPGKAPAPGVMPGGLGGVQLPPPPPPPTLPPMPTPAPPPNTDSGGNSRIPDNYGPPPITVPLPPSLPTIDPKLGIPQPTAQVGLPALGEWSPPAPGVVQARGDIPANPNYKPGNLNSALAGLGATNLPQVPNYNPGTFQDYLGQNGTNAMTPEQIAQQARLRAELEINPQLSQVEQNRQDAAKRFELARQQAGQGKEAALSGLEQGYTDKLKRIQALSLRNGLASSNIPLQEDIMPLTNDYNIQRRGMEESISNRINQLELEAAMGDQSAGREIADLKGRLGQLQARNLSDLTVQERNFGEQARQNRFGEFLGTEGLSRQSAQDKFGNQSALASLQEALRGNRADEFFGQEDLNRTASQQNFGNNMALSQLQEGMRQSDLQNNRTDRSQSFAEWAGQAGVGMDRSRLEDSLLSSNLQRRQGEFDIAQGSDLNSLKNQYLQAQLQGLQAEAARDRAAAENGGLDLFDALDLTKGLTPDIQKEIDILNNPATTPQRKASAQAALAQYESYWNRVNPKVPFQQRWGAALNAPSSPGTQNPSPIVREAERQQVVKAIAEDEANLKNLEFLYDRYIKNGFLPSDGLLEGIAAQIAKITTARDQKKKQIGQ